MRSTFTQFAFVLLLTNFAVAGPVVVPLAEYRFEEIGTTAVNTGTLGATANLTLATSLSDPSDTHSPAGQGVGNTERGLDHRFGNTGVAARGVSAGNVAALDFLTSFTIMGWYDSERADGLVGNERQMVANWDSSAGFAVEGGEVGPNESALRLRVDSSSITSGAGTYPSDGGDYVFFAVTYDGTATSNNVRFYRGTKTSAAVLVATVTLNEGITGDSVERIAVGGRAGLNAPRTFHGLMDDVRIFGATSGTGGALDPSTIEYYRQTALPEPGSLTVLGFAALVTLRRRR